MIHIYYGDGQGKTSAAIGLGMRAYGAKKTVALVRFLKNNDSCELNSVPFDVFKSPDNLGFNPGEEYRPWIKSALNFISDFNGDVLILDEFLDVIPSFVTLDDALKILNKNCELVISGHKDIKEIFERADYITYFKKIKHPYDRGQNARRGFEY